MIVENSPKTDNHLWRRFRRSRSGSAAVEFAFVMPIFFAIVFSMMEAGWLMSKIALTENAVLSISRDIYTGAADPNSSNHQATINQQSLKEKICAGVPLIGDCTNNISLEIIGINTLQDIPTNAAVCRDSFSSAVQPTATYNPAGTSEISVIRVCLTTDILFPGLGLGLHLPKNAQGRYQIVSLLAFVNEPF